MIKIIKHGYVPLKAECPCCGCIFLFTTNDLKTNINKIDAKEYIDCPDCGNRLTWWYSEKSGRIRS